jgi:hypothetical protein
MVVDVSLFLPLRQQDRVEEQQFLFSFVRRLDRAACGNTASDGIDLIQENLPL